MAFDRCLIKDYLLTYLEFKEGKQGGSSFAPPPRS